MVAVAKPVVDRKTLSVVYVLLWTTPSAPVHVDVRVLCAVAFVTNGSRTVVFVERVFGLMVVLPTFTTLLSSVEPFVVCTAAVLVVLSLVPSLVPSVAVDVRSDVGTFDVVVPDGEFDVIGIVDVEGELSGVVLCDGVGGVVEGEFEVVTPVPTTCRF